MMTIYKINNNKYITSENFMQTTEFEYFTVTPQNCPKFAKLSSKIYRIGVPAQTGPLDRRLTHIEHTNSPLQLNVYLA